MKPARKIQNRGCHRVIGRFPSSKAKQSLWWDSQIERDFLFHAEFDSSVSKISGQPFRVSYVTNGKRRRYTPDFLLEGSNKKLVVEVKPHDKSQSPEFGLWKQAVSTVLEKNGYQFVVMTDTQIRAQPLLANLKWLFRFRTANYVAYDLQLLLAHLGRTAMTIADAQLLATKNNLDPNLVWHLVASRTLGVDLNKPLTTLSIINIGSK
jgi:TnsA endonuclease N terminal